MPIIDVTELPDISKLSPPRKLGRWRLNTRNYTIELLRGRRVIYWVDLQRCTTAGETLDWVLQLGAKPNSVSSQDIGDLVRFYLELCPNIQGHLCPFGSTPSRPAPHIDWKKIIKERVKKEKADDGEPD